MQRRGGTKSSGIITSWRAHSLTCRPSWGTSRLRKCTYQKTVSHYIWKFLGWYIKQCPGPKKHQPHHGGSSHWLWEEPAYASVGTPYAQRYAFWESNCDIGNFLVTFLASPLLHPKRPFPHIGSTVLIVSPLTTIEDQLLQDCQHMGIPAVAGSKVYYFLLESFLAFHHPWHLQGGQWGL